LTALKEKTRAKTMRQVRTGVLADCTREEFDRRLRRLREEMARTGVDGLLLTQESNVRYATGWYEVCWVIQAYFWMAFIPRDENLPPMLIIPSGGHNQTQASWIETLAVWEFPVGFYTGNVGAATVDAVVALVKDLGLSEAHIATETGAHFRMGMSVEMFDSLRDALPGARWSDCGKVIWPVRSVKSDEEVRRLRESVRITCLGIQAGFEAICDGVSEREVASIMSQEMHARGGSEIRSLILYAGPDRALWSDSIPRREMIIRPGSLIQFDGGGTYEGYYTDIKRFASLGQPTADQQRYYDLARASQQAAIDAVAPGVPYSEVYDASQRVLRDAGYGDFVDWCISAGRSAIGHNVGLDLHEMPGISSSTDEILQPNQIISIEPYFYHHGLFPISEVKNKYGLEDMVLVTETGHEVLSPDSMLSRDIWVA
jgi:Xaa-Pro aminopeptidase